MTSWHLSYECNKEVQTWLVNALKKCYTEELTLLLLFLEISKQYAFCNSIVDNSRMIQEHVTMNDQIRNPKSI
jgi:hypothetical protein